MTEKKRELREVIDDIDKGVARVLEHIAAANIMAAAKPKVGGDRAPRYRHLVPARLSPKAQDAIKLVLDNVRENGRSVTFDELVDQVNGLEPDCIYKGGDVNNAIRNLCAEMCGIAVRWSANNKIR